MHISLLVIGERVDEVLRRHKELADGSVRFDNAWLGGYWEDGIWLRSQVVFPKDIYIKNRINLQELQDGQPSRCTSCRKIDADFDAMYKHLSDSQDDLQKLFDDYVVGMDNELVRDCIAGSNVKETPTAITEAIASIGCWSQNEGDDAAWRKEWESIVAGIVPNERITIVDCHVSDSE